METSVKILFTELVAFFLFQTFLKATEDKSKEETILGSLTTISFIATILQIVYVIWN